MQIAVYGKGGIGKSTVSANLSAALAKNGKKVLQIGCDPKHDSTRLIRHGQKIRTVLDYLLHTPVDEQTVQDILMEGYLGVGCVEAGGPRPGMGCAGRGILTSFEFLNRFDLISHYDTVIYDVLGDVVCGGFAVPVRSQYADAIFLVTSGEAMSLYAANNILQGIRNLSPGQKRIAGIIYNSRGKGDTPECVENFAAAAGLPVCVRIPRSTTFARAEMEAMTVVEQDENSIESRIFMELARQITNKLPLYPALPLDEEQIEQFLRGEAWTKAAGVPVQLEKTSKAGEKAEVTAFPSPIPQKRALSDPFSRIPLYGCAYRGAVDLAVHVKDTAVLGHAPKSCTWYAVNGISGYSRRGLYERGILYPAFIPQNFENTDITMQDAIFGGVKHARRKALELAKRGAKSIIAVTACIPGMSGDDLTPVKEELESLGCEMYIVRTDGVEAGDYNEGMALCYRTLAKEAVRREIMPEKDSINLVYEHTISSKTDENYIAVKKILDELGIRINCRFLCASSMKDIHGFLRAPYSVMVREDQLGLELKQIFETEYGCRFLPGVLPRGFRETVRWTELLGKLYKKEEEAASLVQQAKMDYEARIRKLKPVFAGKRVLIFLTDTNYGWLFELAQDLELHVERTILLGMKGDSNPAWNRRFSADWASDRRNLEEALEILKPNIVLLNEPSSLESVSDCCRLIPVMRDPGCGFFSGAERAGEWVRLMDRKIEGRWKSDKSLFEKYYS